MSLQTISTETISNKSIEQIGNARIKLPLSIPFDSTTTSSVSIRVNFPFIHFLKSYFVFCLVNNSTTCFIWKFSN